MITPQDLLGGPFATQPTSSTVTSGSIGSNSSLSQDVELIYQPGEVELTEQEFQSRFFITSDVSTSSTTTSSVSATIPAIANSLTTSTLAPCITVVSEAVASAPVDRGQQEDQVLNDICELDVLLDLLKQ